MKIGFVNDYLPNTGIGNYAFSLFSEFQRMKKKTEMIYLNYGKSNEIKDPMKHVSILTTPWKLPFLRQSFNWFFYFPKKIPDGYDIYHVSNQYLSKIAAYKKPCIITCLDIIPLVLKENYPFATRFLLGKAVNFFKKAERILVISEYTKRDIVEKLGIEENKINVTYLGIDKKVFKEIGKKEARKKLGLPLDKKLILHVGSEEPRKNVSLIINAFNILRKSIPDSMLIRIGEKRKETEELINKLRLNKNVLHKKIVKSASEIAMYYNAADVLVFPSSYEGFGFPVLEAMSCGTPVITSNKTSIPEIAGNAAVIMKQLETNELAENMFKVLTDEGLNKKLSRKGLIQAKKFNWEKTAEQTLKVYEDVING